MTTQINRIHDKQVVVFFYYFLFELYSQFDNFDFSIEYLLYTILLNYTETLFFNIVLKGLTIKTRGAFK